MNQNNLDADFTQKGDILGKAVFGGGASGAAMAAALQAGVAYQVVLMWMVWYNFKQTYSINRWSKAYPFIDPGNTEQPLVI